jgi:hypothetical protein
LNLKNNDNRCKVQLLSYYSAILYSVSQSIEGRNTNIYMSQLFIHDLDVTDEEDNNCSKNKIKTSNGKVFVFTSPRWRELYKLSQGKYILSAKGS